MPRDLLLLLLLILLGPLGETREPDTPIPAGGVFARTGPDTGL